LVVAAIGLVMVLVSLALGVAPGHVPMEVHAFATDDPVVTVPPVWVNLLTYGSAGGGFYWDFTSGTVWTAERDWHLFAPESGNPADVLWVNYLTYGSIGGGFYLDPLSGQVWTSERGWHTFSPAPAPAATATPTATGTATRTPTPVASASANATATPPATATPTATFTPSPTATTTAVNVTVSGKITSPEIPGGVPGLTLYWYRLVNGGPAGYYQSTTSPTGDFSVSLLPGSYWVNVTVRLGGGQPGYCDHYYTGQSQLPVNAGIPTPIAVNAPFASFNLVLPAGSTKLEGGSVVCNQATPTPTTSVPGTGFLVAGHVTSPDLPGGVPGASVDAMAGLGYGVQTAADGAYARRLPANSYIFEVTVPRTAGGVCLFLYTGSPQLVKIANGTDTSQAQLVALNADRTGFNFVLPAGYLTLVDGKARCIS